MASSQASSAAITAEDMGEPSLTFRHRQDYPKLILSAERLSLWSKRLYESSIALEQILLVIAAVSGILGGAGGGIFSWWVDGLNVFELIIIVALLLTFGVQLARSLIRPYKTWTEARGLAEAIKAQVWLYIMAVTPYDHGTPAELAERFKQDSQHLKDTVAAKFARSVPNVAPQITPKMTRIHNAPLAARIQVYKRDRVSDQQHFYHLRTRRYENQAMFWNIVLLLIQASAIAIAVVEVTQKTPTDFFGLVGTLVAGGIAWVEAKQFIGLADRYQAMEAKLQRDLRDLAKIPQHAETEAGWSRFVHAVEQSLYEEHEGWLSFHLDLVDRMEGKPMAISHAEKHLHGGRHHEQQVG